MLLHSDLQHNKHITATSFTPPYYPNKAIISEIGWCSDDTESQYIEVDFGAEVIVEAIAILRVGGSCVQKYYVQYARSDEEFHCATEKSSNNTVIIYKLATYIYIYICVCVVIVHHFSLLRTVHITGLRLS